MKQRTKLVVYLIFMTLLISGSLFFGASSTHSDCPICKHSFASEGLMNHPTITINK